MSLTHSTPSIITDGLVLCLDAANRRSYPGSGTVWYDISPNKNHGTFTNGPIYSGINNGVISFDGTDDYIINSSSNNIPIGSSDRTIQVWTYPKSNVNNFVQLGTGGGIQVYLISFYNDNGTIYLFTDGVNVANNITMSSLESPTVNSWNHIIFGNSGQNWFYYLNGILKKSGIWPSTINTIGQKYIIGRRDDNIPYVGYSNSNIAQVSIYNKALTASEIKQNFNALRRRFGI